MTVTLGSWSTPGVLAALAVVAGSVLLIVYAVRRGLVREGLDGTFADEDAEGTMPAAGTVGAIGPSRILGVAGVVVLIVGLGLGLLAVVAGPAAGPSANAPGIAPGDCSQSWNGCPQPTANP